MIKIEKLPTAVTADKYPIHKWFNFVAGYSPEYVELVIEEFINKNKVNPKAIYDPFSGCATTNVVSNIKKIKSLGVERNPFFFKIGYTKANASEAIKYIDQIVMEMEKIACQEANLDNIKELSDSASVYLLKMFSKETLSKLLEMRNHINNYENFKYYMGYTFLSKLLEYTTTAKTDGIYKVPSSVKKAVDIKQAIEKTKNVIRDDENNIKEIKSLSKIVFDSCIQYDLQEKEYDIVVFSPPYLNNFDFAEMTRMQMYFWNEASSWGEISDYHRNHMLVNTTTALKLVKSDDVQNNMRNNLPNVLLEKIDPLVHKLKEIRTQNKKKKQYDLIIYPYLFQMKEVLERCYKGLSDIGEIHIVLSDAAFYGIHVDTQLYIADILEEIGFINVKIIKMRERGDRWKLDKRKFSGKKLGEYEIIGEKG